MNEILAKNIIGSAGQESEENGVEIIRAAAFKGNLALSRAILDRLAASTSADDGPRSARYLKLAAELESEIARRIEKNLKVYSAKLAEQPIKYARLSKTIESLKSAEGMFRK